MLMIPEVRRFEIECSHAWHGLHNDAWEGLKEENLSAGCKWS